MTDDMSSKISDALNHARRELRWRPGKARAHLQKRIGQGHLNVNATMEEYEEIIRRILHEHQAKVT